MRFAFGNWQFDVDVAATMEYSAAEAAGHCDCAYCRNFYAAVDPAYPQLRSFFGSFGVDIDAPDELMPYDLSKEMHYDGYYAVSGRILQSGDAPIQAGNAVILPVAGNDLRINTGCKDPYFFLNISVTLPWVLEEPMVDVVSPANEPAFLRKMWQRLLSKIRIETPGS